MKNCVSNVLLTSLLTSMYSPAANDEIILAISEQWTVFVIFKTICNQDFEFESSIDFVVLHLGPV